MKKNVLKITAILCAAVMLVGASVWLTYAYLTSSSTVYNVFTVGQVSIGLYESKVDTSGVVIEDGSTNPFGGTKTAEFNTYHLLPGNTYVKDPTIYISASSAPSILFVKIDNGIAALEEGNFTHTGQTDVIEKKAPTIEQQMMANGWSRLHNKNGDAINSYDGSAVYVYRGFTGDVLNTDATAVPASVGSVKVFESFTVDAHAHTILSQYDGASVKVTAYAVQQLEAPEAGDTRLLGERAWQAIVDTYAYEGNLPTTPDESN